jgi:hypothetical protein
VLNQDRKVAVDRDASRFVAGEITSWVGDWEMQDAKDDVSDACVVCWSCHERDCMALGI